MPLRINTLASFGVGSQHQVSSFNDSNSLGSVLGFSPTRNIKAFKTVLLGAVSSFSIASKLDAVKSISLGAVSGVSKSASLNAFNSIAQDALTSLVIDGVVVGPTGAALGLVGGINNQSVLNAFRSATLALQNGISDQGKVVASRSTALALQAGLSNQSGLSLFSSESVALQGSIAVAYNLPLITYETVLTDTTSDTNHTFSSVNFGTAIADRYVLVRIAFTNSTARTLNSVTIGGITATLGARGTASAVSPNVAIYYANVPTGTSGDIVLSFSGNVSRKIVKVTVFSGLKGNAPETTDGVTGTTALTLSSAGIAVVWELWANALTTNSQWLQGPYQDDLSTNLGSGATPLSANFGARLFDRAAATINGNVADTNANQAKAGVVWKMPSFTESICNLYDEFSDTTDQTTVTTAALQIGTDVGSRMVVVGFGWSAAASRTITSVTIGGVTASNVVTNSSSTGGAAIFKATGVSGTTAVVVITFSSTITRIGGTIFRTTPASTTEVDADSTSTTSTAMTLSNVEVSNGGFCILILRNNHTTDNVTLTWSGVDLMQMDHHISLESATRTRAGYFLTTESDATRDFQMNTTNSAAKNLCAASWL